MRKLFRADDAGSSLGANRAILETVEEGVVRNVSFMVPGPAFADAVALLGGLQNVDFGLHVTLNAEWDAPKWGPILPPSQIPTLVTADGYFTQNPGILQGRVAFDEAIAEVAAQLAQARAAGLRIDYLDEHMGVGWIQEREGGERFSDRLRSLAHAENLVYAADVDASLVEVFHPGSDDDPVMANFLHEGLLPGQIHAERIADRKRLTGPEFRGYDSITYREAGGRT